MTALGLLGAPSSAGAYAAGQERAPGALRAAGLVQALQAAGFDVQDHGDTPAFRWRPDSVDPRAQNLRAVVDSVRAVAAGVEAIVRAGQVALVVGGDCTNGIGTYAGAVAALGDAGLVYVDKHTDLNVPDSTVDGALDWMGVAHLLGLEGVRAALRDAGSRTPLLTVEGLVVLGWRAESSTAFERETVQRLGVRTISDEDLVADPAKAAGRALAAVTGRERLVVHLDVDVLDYLDAPLAENTDRNGGPSLDATFTALGILMAAGRVAAVTVAELNPDHAPEPELLARFVTGLAAALAR